MNKSSNVNRVRRVATTAAGIAISVIGICATAPCAFAELVIPDGGGSPVHHSGTAGWEIALIVVVAVALIALSLLATIRGYNRSKQPNIDLTGRPAASAGSLSRASR